MKTDAIFVSRVNYATGIRGLSEEVYISRKRWSSVSEIQKTVSDLNTLFRQTQRFRLRNELD